MPGGLVIPAGARSRSYSLAARRDGQAEPPETLLVTLRPNYAYQFGTRLTAGLELLDCHPATGLAAAAGWLYPNPVAEELHIETTQEVGELKVQIFSLLGTLLMEKAAQSSPDLVCNLAHLPKGFYLVRVLADGQPVQTSRRVKE
jgi:hypothetical protein